MKKILVGAVVFAAIAAAAPAAQAQQQGNVTFGISGGLTLPVGDLGDVQGSGYGLMGHAGIKPASSPFALRADLGIVTASGKTVEPIGGGSGFTTQQITFTTLNANAIYNFEGAKDATFVPYVIGGAGIYNGNRGIGTKFGINGGGGVTFKLSGFDAFAEARFHNIFAEGGSARIIPVMFGINFKP